MTVLRSRNAEADAQPHGFNQQANHADAQPASTVFDARDRLNGTLDDTIVRQAVVVQSDASAAPVSSE